MSEIELASRIKRAVLKGMRNKVGDRVGLVPVDWHRAAAREAVAYLLERLGNQADDLRDLCDPDAAPPVPADQDAADSYVSVAAADQYFTDRGSPAACFAWSGQPVTAELLQTSGDPELDRLVTVALRMFLANDRCYSQGAAVKDAAHLIDACRDYRQRQTDDVPSDDAEAAHVDEELRRSLEIEGMSLDDIRRFVEDLDHTDTEALRDALYALVEYIAETESEAELNRRLDGGES